MNNLELDFKNLFLIGLIILFYTANSSADRLQISALEQLLNNSYQKDIAYRAPTHSQATKAQDLFASALQSKSFSKEQAAAWQNLGFKIAKVKNHNIDYLVISEHPQAEPMGRGFYVIKTSDNSANILQAPHRPTDEYTYKIIFKLLLEGNYRAASWNSLSRKSADLAKEPASYFNAFTLAAASSFAQGMIVQLHGFDSAVHKIDVDMILSSATKEPDATYTKVKNCLSAAENFKKFKILQFPVDIKELGGTFNINAKLFYQQNAKAHFFHIETSKRLRTALLNEQGLRNQFSKCFTKNFDRKLDDA